MSLQSVKEFVTLMHYILTVVRAAFEVCESILRIHWIWISGVFSMQTGKVKWFNNAKGYGFILSEDHNEDLFAHYSAIQTDGYKSLKAGQTVEFETAPGPKGLHAVNIRPVSA